MPGKSLPDRLTGVRRLRAILRLAYFGNRGDYHFVRDYQRWISYLLARHPHDEAMALAVGGDYERIGEVEFALLRHFGLREGSALVDFGCGSGRLAAAVGRGPLHIDYQGFDIDQRLLDYAKSRSPSHFRFTLNRALTLPMPAAAADFACAFSVFTHLTHAETYLYLQDLHRILRPDGMVLFSFLEFAEPSHWPIFADTVADTQRGTSIHLNQFIERTAIDVWAEKLGYRRKLLSPPMLRHGASSGRSARRSPYCGVPDRPARRAGSTCTAPSRTSTCRETYP
jgi:ubiquinone/menaquinone biosynthesis C-methylase UbiE